MIEIKNLTKKFGENTILDDISFKVNKGEILGFLGPNGAGKSTTMKIITSFWAPSEGTVLVDNIDVTENSLATRKKIGYLPETVPLYDEMRVNEYLKFIGEMRGLKKEEIKKRIDEVARTCGLEKVLKQPIEELSKGYRQRVGLAQAIMHEPDILILDEPTTGLDPNQIIEIRDLIKQIGKEKTVIFSTHILSEASATCDRVIIINKGRIAGEGSPDELASKAGAQAIIYAKLKGAQEKVLQTLKSVEHVSNIKVANKEAEDIYGYEIEEEPGFDIRENILKAALNAGLGVLEINKKSVSLEDVFRQLTK